MKFIPILINEGRKEDLKKKYSTKFNEQDLEFILNISDLKDFNHKYTDFVLKNTDGDGELDTDELEHLVGLIKDFDKYQSQFPKKDINQYVSLNELEKVILYIRDKNKEKELESQADRIYENDKFLVIKPKTEEASCKYGSNTKWCVTSKGSGHFGRYTSGSQILYFIINKQNSTNQNYSKVAVHFNNEGEPTYWNSQDIALSNKEIDVLEYAFPEVIDSIKKDHKINSFSKNELLLKRLFSVYRSSHSRLKNYLNSNLNLDVLVEGFEDVDAEFGHSHGLIQIQLINPDFTRVELDLYRMFVIYQLVDNKHFNFSISFDGGEMDDSSNFIDLNLENLNFNSTTLLPKSIDLLYIDNTGDNIRTYIGNRILSHIKLNPALSQKVAGTSKIWQPNRPSYGYTFKQNKGLIKSLINWIDSNDDGTKLDFLESIGKLKSKVVNGKKLYSKGGDFLPSSDWRGHFSSFFASAKLAGIIEYVKKGNKFIITKGPNFEAFKNGELKAL
jgi:hypothetical protein